MPNSFDTSFIPQQPLLKMEGFSRRPESISLILVIALVAFFSTLAVYGGFYFFKTTVVEKRIANLEKELQSKEEKLKIADIENYKTIDTRIGIAKRLLQNHTAFSNILELLEKITAQSVGWTQFSYTVGDSDGLIRVSLTGQAPSYGAVYSQVEQWRGMTKELREVDVTTPALDPVTGVVSFSATLVLDPSIMKYETGNPDAEIVDVMPVEISPENTL